MSLKYFLSVVRDVHWYVHRLKSMIFRYALKYSSKKYSVCEEHMEQGQLNRHTYTSCMMRHEGLYNIFSLYVWTFP